MGRLRSDHPDHGLIGGSEVTDAEMQEIIDLVNELKALPDQTPLVQKATKFVRVLGKRVRELEHRYPHVRFNEVRDDYE